MVYANGGKTLNCFSFTSVFVLPCVVPLSFSSLIGEDEEKVKKWRSLIRNLTNGIWDVILFESSDVRRREEEIGVEGEVVAVVGMGKVRVLFAPTQGFIKPQLGYLM